MVIGEVVYGFSNLAFLISYISLFSYWSVLAWTKYQDEPNMQLKIDKNIKVAHKILGYRDPRCKHEYLDSP